MFGSRSAGETSLAPELCRWIVDVKEMQQSKRPRWEYETVRPERDATKKETLDPKATLNEPSADGWERVETLTDEGAR